MEHRLLKFSICLTLLMPSVVLAVPFRHVGYEALETALMEADAVLDVRQTSLERGTVTSVIYGYDLLEFSVTEGSQIEIKNLPLFEVPLFDSPGSDALYVKEAQKKVRKNRITRGLVFVQPDRVDSIRRFSEEQDPVGLNRDNNSQSKELEFLPRVVMGSNAFSWWSQHNRDTGRKESQWLDSSWPTMAIVEDIGTGQLRPFRKRIHDFEGSFITPTAAARYRTRRYVVPEEVANWGGLISRLKKAVGIRTKFNLARQNMPDDKRAEFYLSMVKDERVFANYALEEIAKFSDRAMAQSLLKLIPDLLYYVDDAWETALKIVSKEDSEPRLPAFTSFVDLVETFTESDCATAEQATKRFAEASEKFGNPEASLQLGLVSPDSTLSLIFRLYEAELKCFLTHRAIDRKSLLPDASEGSYEELLSKGTNTGFTLDEVGMLGPINPFTARKLRARQRVLFEFEPKHTTAALSQIANVPSGLRELISYCAYGLGNYEKVGLPDLTLGAHSVWKFSCDQLADYQWPENYCSSADSRLQKELSDYGAMLAKALLVSIENDDLDLMNFAFDVLAKVPTRHNASLVASVIPLTTSFAEQDTRTAFIEELPRLSYFSVAAALGREYAVAQGEHQAQLQRVLREITSADPQVAAEANQDVKNRKWINFFENLRERRKDGEEPGLFAAKALLNAIHQPPCDKLNVGWNGRWRKLKLPE